jgi:pimeloyl-ACP methyl ester carboxylesterase
MRTALTRAFATAALALAATSALPATAAAQGPSDVVDIPLAFSVTNLDRSQVPCASDAGRHVVRGHLVAPRAFLSSPGTPSVTVYLHSLSTGEWQWRFPGMDYAAQMAARGLASVTIDRLGYGASDRPHGMLLCVGADADVLHQIIGALRAGTYTATGAQPVRFGRIAVAGPSIGGLIAEIEAYSFHDVHGLVELGYADGGTNFSADDVVTGMGAGRPCLFSGYADFTTPERARQAFYGVPDDVTDRAMALRSRDPCGDLISSFAATAVNLARVRRIDTHVLLVYGRQDLTVRASAAAGQRARFTGSGDVTSVFLEGTGHFFMLGATADRFRDVMAAWLAARRL